MKGEHWRINHGDGVPVARWQDMTFSTAMPFTIVR